MDSMEEDRLKDMFSGSLSYDDQIEKAQQRAENKDKPYWAFVWKDPKTGNTGVVNFKMTEDKAHPYFNRTHPDVRDYMAIGAD